MGIKVLVLAHMMIDNPSFSLKVASVDSIKAFIMADNMRYRSS